MTNPSDLHTWLSDPARIRAITQAIGAKVPTSDVEDVVQSTLADALTAAEPPHEEAAFDRWLFGIARHKVADHYRRHRHQEVVDSDTVATTAHLEATPETARDLLRWVDQELPKQPETTRTLEWMMREASGDRLETIAKEHELSAPAVRQRISRLRRYLRERWALELTAALGLLVVVTGLFAYRQRHIQPPIGPEIVGVAPSAAESARRLREAALSACRAGEWRPCLVGLDRARALDPLGDSAEVVQSARLGAARALNPSPTPTATPNPSAPPRPSATPNPPAKPTSPVRSMPKERQTPQAPKKYSPSSKAGLQSEFELQ
jgi:RNA polymerase sigma factor (sigma-70 family)